MTLPTVSEGEDWLTDGAGGISNALTTLIYALQERQAMLGQDLETNPKSGAIVTFSASGIPADGSRYNIGRIWAWISGNCTSFAQSHGASSGIGWPGAPLDPTSGYPSPWTLTALLNSAGVANGPAHSTFLAQSFSPTRSICSFAALNG